MKIVEGSCKGGEGQSRAVSRAVSREKLVADEFMVT